MLKLFILILVFSSSVVFADDKAPAPFEDSDIERVLKDGKVQKFDGNRYKIVPRKKNDDSKPKVKTKIVKVTKKVVRLREPPKNSVSAFTGYGPSGLDREGTTVRTERDIVFGIGYDRRINTGSSLRVIGISNGTIMGGVGFDF